ncbi:unnamed protein product [Mytilus edulis]|uniref:Uncharacterized protein n=1 Tax=Mytilus edulis TaxID=6550 RepID=A0A8S3TY98_MYTED|nr:unnamed protein product [Mytilus edulis]
MLCKVCNKHQSHGSNGSQTWSTVGYKLLRKDKIQIHQDREHHKCAITLDMAHTIDDMASNMSPGAQKAVKDALTENRHSTRVNSNKIIHQRFKTSLRKNSFSVRIAKLWNKLPDKVTKAPSINSFKNRLDRYWEYEEIYYSDYRAELTGSSIRNNGDNIQLYESGEEEPVRILYRKTSLSK